MKRRLLAGVLTFVMVLSLLPTAVLAEETSGQEGEESASQTVKDIYGDEWTFTTSVDNSTITMVQGENRIVAEFADSTLTFTGSGTMPVLNDSTDAVSGNQLTAYPWAGWKDSVTKIVIGDGITGVGAKSFITWPNVGEVQLGKDVATIGAGAFAQLTACTQFTVDASNTSFKAENGVLYSKGQEKLYYYPCAKTGTGFNVPDTVTELGYNAVCKNDSLQTVSFTGEETLHFGYGSMFGNTALTTVNLDRPNATFDTFVFSNDTALKVVYCRTSEVKGAANKLMNDTQSGAVALLKDGEYDKKEADYIYAVDSEGAIICGYEGNETVLVLPNELGGKAVTVIAANTFANLEGNRNITKVTIPASVKSIEPDAFLGGADYQHSDSMLTDITILGTDVEIGSMAFARHQNLRIDMTKVTNLKADSNAFSSVSKIIVSKDAQEDMRTALAENSSVNQNTKVYIDTDENNAFYWHYVNGKWVIVSSGTSSFQDEQGLIYTVNYTVEGATVAATAAITGYNKLKTSTATGLVIPKTLPFTDASGNEAQATVVSISSGLRGYNDKPVKNGIKTLTVEADLPSLNTTFVYWNDLETVNILGNVASLVNCFTGCSALKQVYFGDQENITFGSSAFGNVPHLGVIDLSNVKTVTMTSTPGYSNAITNFYSNTSGNVTMVYVGSEAVYQAINEVTVAGETKSGFDFTNKRNIVAVTNGGTFENPPMNNTALATPVKAGYKFGGWYENADFSGNAVPAAPTAGKTYYAKWTMADSISLTSDAESSVTYGTTVTLTASPVNSSWGYVWYKDANENGELELSTDKQINNNKCTLALTDVSDSGMYWVLVNDRSSTKTSNSVNVTITKADGTASVSMDGWAYGETAKTPVPTSATNGTDHVTYQYKGKDADDSTYSDAVPTAAGSYTVKATFPETVNYNAVTATDDFTITKATYNMTGVKFEDASYTYDGNEKTLTISGTLPTGVTVAYENNKLTNAGSVTAKAKFTIADSNNYCAIKDMTATLTITKAKPTVSISAKPDSLRGGGKVTLTVTGVPEEGNVIVTCDNGITVDNANGTYSAVLPNRTVDYTFTLNYTGVENGNYRDATATCTVSVTRRHTSSVTPGNTVSVPSTPNGTVTVSPSTASKGETVTITTKPNEGYELGSIEVLDKNGDSLKLKDLGNGKYSFVMPDGKVSVEAEFVKTAATSFADVPANAFFADAVKWAVDMGVTNGLSDTMFGPYEPCTRAQIVTFLWRAAGSPEPKTASSFTDVPASAYYAKAVAWAIENGITNGMTATEFAPDATCTRGQSVTFLYRALKGTASGSANFTDVKSDAFYADAINWAVANNVTNGTSNTTFSPNADCTRAEIVTFLYRAYQGK